MKALLYIIGPCLLVVGCGESGTTTPPIAKDNTAINQRDESGTSVTPLDQSNEKSDVELTAEIRKKVLEIDGLSVNGQNIKIVSNAGDVVLRGPVASDAEKDQIGHVATAVAGENHVTNELEVESN